MLTRAVFAGVGIDPLKRWEETKFALSGGRISVEETVAKNNLFGGTGKWNLVELVELRGFFDGVRWNLAVCFFVEWRVLLFGCFEAGGG
jgi:hypothetical protein